jgi:hypothetical protein
VRNAGIVGSQDVSEDQEIRDYHRQDAPEAQAETHQAPRPASETPMPEEPIDRISAFHALEEKNAEAQDDDGDDREFGRQRRPYTRHRRGRQSKPRETRNRQSLGGNNSKEEEESTPDPPMTQPEPQGRRGRMENGIGPIDLDEPDSSEEE